MLRGLGRPRARGPAGAGISSSFGTAPSCASSETGACKTHVFSDSRPGCPASSRPVPKRSALPCLSRAHRRRCTAPALRKSCGRGHFSSRFGRAANACRRLGEALAKGALLPRWLPNCRREASQREDATLPRRRPNFLERVQLAHGSVIHGPSPLGGSSRGTRRSRHAEARHARGSR